MTKKADILNEWTQRVEDELLFRITSPYIRKELAKHLINGAIEGKEIEVTFTSKREKELAKQVFEAWIERASRQFVWLDRSDYSRALIRALKLSLEFVAADYDRSKRRDWAQIWTDTARGFLGEIALSKFFKEKFEIELILDNRKIPLEEALESDVIGIKVQGGKTIKPTKRISIKTSKFQARWLDIPGEQISKSDVFFLVKIGISDKHFLSYLKDISFLRDKLFQEGKTISEITEEEADQLWNSIENLEPIPAYIPGFLLKESINLPIHELKFRLKGKKQEITRKATVEITKALGLITIPNIKNFILSKTNLDDFKKLLENKNIGDETAQTIRNIVQNDKVEYIISGIGRVISSKYKHFLATSGSLKNDPNEFEKLLTIILGATNA